MTLREASKKIVFDLNDRSGVYIDFDDDIMQEIYAEIEATIKKVAPPQEAQQ